VTAPVAADDVPGVLGALDDAGVMNSAGWTLTRDIRIEQVSVITAISS
jgi:hypothetical protein